VRWTIGLLLLVAAWVVVLVGARWQNLRIPWFRGSLSVEFLAVPLLLASLVILLSTRHVGKGR
jgi:hypothetical protein